MISNPGVKIMFGALVLVVANSASAFAKCGSGLVMKSESASSFEVSMDAGAQKISTSEPLTVHVSVCPTGNGGIERFKFDATMPAHGHGMNYVPEITDRGENRYSASGLLLHMPGMWRFEVSFGFGGKIHRFIRDVEVE